ncbi:MAG TPA: alpha-2-macroglobulin family protein, partial [Pyrinomonadaceae bacterium]|nr:alpha-2-macroglobulin family protein [Pyrinomonadaceae bacterium]
VEVRADYLFGKPVTKGKVRVVRENSREWNWKEQKYDIEEGEKHEGNTDAEGKFTAKFDLSEAHEDLEDSDYYKFRDLKFTAYFTDSTTNKTEQRRFDVRVTREPIHVYFIGNRYDQNPALPVNGYVSTFYADGTPAQCEVEIKGREEDTDDKLKTLQRLKTNSFGAGKIEFMRPKFEHEDDDLEIRITAKDGKGNKGTFGEEIYFDVDNDALRIKTEKSIFKPGEAVEIKLKSNRQTGLVYVDVVKGWSVIDSYFVNLKNGKAEVKIPYKPNFKGELKIAAFMEDEEDDLIEASRGIVFPSPQNLKVEAEFDKESYKPSEEARVNFSVLDSIGNTVESVLGVVIFDRAIEERARTESEFNGMFSNYSGWLGYGDSFGGVNVKDLNDLDLSKPIADELQLVAEVMFQDRYYRPNIFRSRSYDTEAKSVYAEYFTKQFTPIEKILKEHYEKRNFEHPTDEQFLRRILSENGVNFDDLRDVWEQKYRAVFSVEKTNDTLQIFSAGADKIFDTKDDFTVSSASFLYFTPTGNAIDKAVKDFHTRTGEYIRDEKTLFAELGITELKDRFGRPYHIDFEVSGKFYLINFRSFGKDGIFEKYYYRGDDFQVFSSKIDYFADTEAKILKILQAAKSFPKDETEFKTILAQNDLDFDKIRDGYGEKLYLVKKQFSRYTDKVTIENVQKYGEEKQIQRTVITPVTQEIITFDIRGKGADRRENSSDDLTFAQFTHVLSEQSKDDEKPKPVTKKIVFTNGTGSISGTVTDPNGAVIPGAILTVKSIGTTAGYNGTTTTDENGYYLLLQIPAGTYQVSATASGFKNSVRTSVPVTANNTTQVNFTLDIGAASTVVSVNADVTTLDTSSSKISANEIKSLPINGRNYVGVKIVTKSGETEEGETTQNQKSTPRLREYFPETLVWNPQIVTDASGKATLNFKMADNITTWKLYTIASTKDGKIGVAEKEITAFQPFFVDLEPPRVLTNGDEIFLPTQVRNYTPTKQKVDVTMSKSDWFSFLNAETRTLVSVPNSQTQKIEVLPNSAKNAVFGFKAIAPVKDGKQKVTAIAEKESDAIEKPVTVRPNGQEIVRTDSKLFRSGTNFEINFPSNALPKTPKAELKIYPNLMAHVTESVEGLLQRPYGCGEQTISSTYPNLMILKFTKSDNLLTQKAKKYLQKGYERLLSYQSADGGFSYWGGKDSSDIALTAYALRFLNDARVAIEVDAKVIENAQNYLIKQQRADGSFTKKYTWETTEDAKRTKLFTSYVVRTLALLKTDKVVLDKGLAYLKTRNAEIDEPYALALFGLASLDAGNLTDAKAIAERLEKMALNEGDKVYWNLETNTPFYGWGTAGRIETTALVLQFLLKSKDESPKTKDLISKATIFLLKSKDRYGVWYSTQTTINVLDAFLASLSESKNQTIQVSMNGEKLKDFAVSSDQIEPFILDLTDKLSSANRVEITSSDDSTLMAQVVSTHYIDWENSEISNQNINQSRQLRFDYKCDKLTAKIMDEITCAVEAERFGFQGYGMLLAEIGLPPGADVSRESLEKAFDADWSLSRYDVLPDRIVIYMWSKAGGTKFNFKFKPRYGINAQTPASVVYDYYNPEAQAMVAPLRFEVK